MGFEVLHIKRSGCEELLKTGLGQGSVLPGEIFYLLLTDCLASCVLNGFQESAADVCDFVFRVCVIGQLVVKGSLIVPSIDPGLVELMGAGGEVVILSV